MPDDVLEEHVYIMTKKFDVYLLIKVLFILIALSLIVIIRAGYYEMDTLERLDESYPASYFTPLAFNYIAIRLLSFGALFAVCFDLKAAMEKRLHLNKKRFILSIILLLLSLINYHSLFFSQQWIGGIWSIKYLISTEYLTLVVSAIAGSLCCSSFKTE